MTNVLDTRRQRTRLEAELGWIIKIIEEVLGLARFVQGEVLGTVAEPVRDGSKIRGRGHGTVERHQQSTMIEQEVLELSPVPALCRSVTAFQRRRRRPETGSRRTVHGRSTTAS